MDRENIKPGSKTKNRTGNDGHNHQTKKVKVVWTRGTNG